MNIERIFKNLLIVHLLMIIIAFIWGAVGESVITTTEEPELNSIELVMLLIFIIYIINIFLLLNFKPLGKNLYVPLVMFMFALTFGLPKEYIIHGSASEYVLNDVDMMITGMIIAMLHWTDVKKKFEG
jgi:hypothetical protein